MITVMIVSLSVKRGNSLFNFNWVRKRTTELLLLDLHHQTHHDVVMLLIKKRKSVVTILAVLVCLFELDNDSILIDLIFLTQSETNLNNCFLSN